MSGGKEDKKNKDGKRPFPITAWELISEPSMQEYASWSPSGDSFVIKKPTEFANAWKSAFKHHNINSFVRQLNCYGFHKVENPQLQPPSMEFKHEYFLRGRPDLLQQIIRKKTPKSKSKTTTSAPNAPSESPTEYLTQALLQLKPDPSEVEPTLEFDSLSKQNEDLTRINELLVREVLRLSNQQKSTSDAVSKILHELVQSRKESQELREQMSQLLKSSPSTFQQTTPFPSNNFPSNQTVPASPVHYSHQSSMSPSPSPFSNGVPSSPAHYSQQSVPPSPLHYSQTSSPNHRSQSVSSGDLPLADIENFHLSNQGIDFIQLLQSQQFQLQTPPQTPPYSPAHQTNFSSPLSPPLFSYEQQHQ